MPSGRRSWRQTLVVIVSSLLVLVGVIGLVAHYRAPGSTWSLGASALAPYLMLGAPAAAVLLVVTRHWLPLVVALAVAGISISTQVPLYTQTTAPTDTTSFVTMTSNLKLGTADAAAVVAAAKRHNVDALMLEELTSDEQRRLVAARRNKLLSNPVSTPGGAPTPRERHRTLEPIPLDWLRRV